ncbi:MAG: hypothetical protein HYY02_05910 [Chloroflexi bacterium]|nr:hypothetical protein [Chloroflexota bacterium]
MPPIGWHVATAREVLQRLGAGAPEEHLGCYYLGSTAPDIRVITRQPREETHYYDLSLPQSESGVPKLLETHPHLLQLQGRARAFMEGYITHLAVDELWIEQVFRPYFGRESSLSDRFRANIMDRVLQFYMDRAEREDRDLFQAFYEHVFRADPGEEVGFIDLPTMYRWRQVVSNILTQDPNWEGFRAFLGRRFLDDGQVADERARDLLEHLPDLLEEVLRYVTPERVVAFREDAIQRATAAVRGYRS